MDKLGILAGPVEHAHRPDRRALDHAEVQARVQREGAMDPNRATPPVPISASCKVKLADRLRLPELLPGCFRIRRPLPLLVSQAASFLVKRSGGRGVPSDHAMVEPMGA